MSIFNHLIFPHSPLIPSTAVVGQGDAEMELKPRVKETGRKEASAPMESKLGQALLGRTGQGRLPVGGVPRKELPGHREWKECEQPSQGTWG